MVETMMTLRDESGSKQLDEELYSNNQSVFY